MKGMKIKQNSVNLKLKMGCPFKSLYPEKKHTLPYIRFVFKCVVMYF